MFEQHNITDPSQVIPAVLAFASVAGWTVAGANVTRPGGGRTFTLAYAAGTFTVTDTADSTRYTKTHIPELKGTFTTNDTGNPEIQVVTSLHLFGDVEPEPFLAIVLECGFNLYRHIYVGNMEKLGNYTGGEVIGSTAQPRIPGNNFVNFYDIGNNEVSNFLFGGRRSGASYASAELADDAGGVNVVHADNAVPWRRFRAARGFGMVLTEDVALGGARDEINDGLVERGKASYASAAVLVPINLYTTRFASPDTRFIPIGIPAGVRMINMDGLDPGSDITISNKLWRVFPQLSKQTKRAVFRLPGGYATGESSELYGLAYPKE